MSQISRFPNDNVGLAIFVNSDLYGTPVHTLLKYHLADRIFGDKSIDWNER